VKQNLKVGAMMDVLALSAFFIITTNSMNEVQDAEARNMRAVHFLFIHSVNTVYRTLKSHIEPLISCHFSP